MSEIEDIKKLSPEERVKKLKELIEKRNKEIEDRNKEIEEAEQLSKQARKDEEDKALRDKIEVPELEEVDISNLFHKEQEDLESKAEEAPKEEEPEDAKALYQIAPNAPTQDLYSNVVDLYNQVKDQGMITPEMAEQAGNIQYAIDKKQEDMTAGNYTAAEKIEQQANVAKNIADKILSLYTAGVKKPNGVQVWK